MIFTENVFTVLRAVKELESASIAQIEYKTDLANSSVVSGLKALIKAGCVSFEIVCKRPQKGQARSLYAVTAAGLDALSTYKPPCTKIEAVMDDVSHRLLHTDWSCAA